MLASMRSKASTARSRISAVTCRLGHSVEAEKKPAITASRPVVTAVRSPGNSRAATTPKCLRNWVRSQRSRPKMRTTIPGRTMG